MFNNKKIASENTLNLRKKILHIRYTKKITETSQREDESFFCAYYYSQMIDQMKNSKIEKEIGAMIPYFFDNLLEEDERTNLTYFPYIINSINKHLNLIGDELRVMRGKSPNHKATIFYKP